MDYLKKLPMYDEMKFSFDIIVTFTISELTGFFEDFTDHHRFKLYILAVVFSFALAIIGEKCG